MKPIITLVGLTIVLAAAAARADAPKLVRSEPPDGAGGVPVDIGVIRFWFDQDMSRGAWTFWQSDRGEFPPQQGDNDRPWHDTRCCELRIGKLKPDTTYAIQLNSARRQGFRSAADEPLPVTVIVFKTGDAAAGAIRPEDLRGAVRVRPGQEPDGELPRQIVGSWFIRTQEFELRIEFAPDGRFSRVSRNAQRSDTTRGTWKVVGDQMHCKVDGDDELLRLTIKMPDRNTLELWEGQESGLRLIRENSAPPAVQQPRPAGDERGTGQSGGRPVCPSGWTELKHPMIGVQAYIPPDYWARMQGGIMFSVEKQDASGTMAFVVPMCPRRGATPQQIAEHFAQLAGKAEPRLRARVVSTAADRALCEFTSVYREKPVEGKYCTIVSAGGSMAFVIGIMAPQGQLQRELPTLEQIARGFGFIPPRGRWINYQSPAGGFTMLIPQGWQVQSGDGQSPKDDIDWIAMDPQKPLSRAFQWCPRVCSPYLMQDPLHAMRGYQAGGFQSHEQAVVASLSQIAQNVRLRKLEVNTQLTQLFRALARDTAQLLGAMGGMQTDVVVYDCLAEASVEGQPVVVAFITSIQTTAMNAGVMGQALDYRITLRGWCAAPQDFMNDTPVLEKACSSMQLSAAFLNRITQGNAKAAAKIQETYAYMNEVDKQIRDKHWDTMGAIAEMNYDSLSSTFAVFGRRFS